MRTISFLLVGWVGVVLAGQCDEAESRLWLEDYSFTRRIGSCAVRHMGAAASTAECIRKGLPLSLPCAMCFGGATECGRNHCMTECIADSASPECIACTKRSGCASGLDVCTGFGGPPEPTQAPAGMAMDNQDDSASHHGSVSHWLALAIAMTLAVTAP